jgi:hypothetical protein
MINPLHKLTAALGELAQAHENLQKVRDEFQYKEPSEYLSAAIEEFEQLKVQDWELPYDN